MRRYEVPEGQYFSTRFQNALDRQRRQRHKSQEKVASVVAKKHSKQPSEQMSKTPDKKKEKTAKNGNTNREKKRHKLRREYSSFLKEANVETRTLERLDRTFREADTSRDGVLQETEFASLLRKFGVRNPVVIERMFFLADMDANGVVDRHEFMRNMVLFVKGTPEEKAEYIFNLRDTRGRGVLTTTDISELLGSELVLHAARDEDALNDNKNDGDAFFLACRIMDKMDTNGTGEVTLEQFTKVFREEPLLAEIFGDHLDSIEV